MKPLALTTRILLLLHVSLLVAFSQTNPVLVSSVNLGYGCSGVATTNGFVFVTKSPQFAPFSGLNIFNVSDPANPVNTGYSDDGQWYARGVILADQRAYVVYANRLQILDISDPAHPTPMGQVLGYYWQFRKIWSA